MEELGAHLFKNDTVSIEAAGYDKCLPKSSKLFKEIEDSIDGSASFGIYNEMQTEHHVNDLFPLSTEGVSGVVSEES